jgi:hypothetical protein
MDRRMERSRGERSERAGNEAELEPMGYLDARAGGQPSGFND